MPELSPFKNAVSALAMTIVLVACGGPAEEASQTAMGSSDSPPTEAARADDPAAPATDSDESHPLGEPLDHPERYYGLYANPDTPNRDWFVTEAKRPEYAEQAPEIPPGYLMIGAMFADVAPWTLRSVSESEFVQAWVSDFQPEPVTVVFEFGDDGAAVAMTFTDEQNASQGRLERQGDVPKEWR